MSNMKRRALIVIAAVALTSVALPRSASAAPTTWLR